jgi:hypothetical protein
MITRYRRPQAAWEWLDGSDLSAGSGSSLAENGSRNIYSRRSRNSGAAMRYRNEIVPFAAMSALGAAIMVVFAVTVMH